MSELIGRREFLRLVTAGVAAADLLVVAGGLLNVAEAQTLRPWTSPRWWPIFPKTASSHGLPRLMDVGGPLHEHDVTARRVFDYQTQALAEGITWFNYVIDNYPEMESWAGYCPPLSSAGIFEPEPWTGRYLKETKEGLLVAKHAPDPMIPISTEGMKTLLSRGRSVIVNSPSPGISGRWFRAAYYINGSRIGVTAWGAGHIEVPISSVVSAWVPINDPEGVVKVAEGIRDHTEPWRITDLKIDVVDYIVNS